MKLSARLLIFLIICALSTQGLRAEDTQDSAVAIELTKFDVNNTTLELAWKIKNNTDHDIWTCESIYWTSPKFEIFLDKDTTTLIIRRQFNLPKEENVNWELPKRGSFARLRPGQEKYESLSLDMPVKPNPVFGTLYANSEFASRVALEIGFFDEDLPNMILRIVELAEKLNCDISQTSPFYDDLKISDRFFRGVIIARAFYFESFKYFRDSVMSTGDEVMIPHMGDWGPVLDGEDVLRIEVDNVSVPYKSSYPPLENKDVNEPSESHDFEESAVSTELTHFEITDTNLELAWNIKNNTDHDVWICDTINAYNPSYKQFEVYMPEDEQTLLIRRRLDVPTVLVWAVHPQGRYVLLRSGQEQNESLSLDVPVKHQHGFSSGRTMSDHARRLVLEIGFYNEDLPGMIRDIIEIEEKLNCVQLQPVEYENPLFIYFFKGIWIAHKFYAGLSNFDEHVYQEGNEEITIPYTWQNLGSEQVLRIEVDGVHIPYED